MVSDKDAKLCMISGETPHKREPNHEQVSVRLGPFTYAGFVTEFATQLAEGSVHRAGGGVTHVGEYVRVDVEGKAYIGVAQKRLDELGVHVLPQ